MGFFGRKPTAKTTPQTPEPSLKINGCTFEGAIVRKLMSDFHRKNPEELQNLLSNIFQELGITSSLTATKTEMTTADGKTINFSGSSSGIMGPYYPHISISTKNSNESFEIKNGKAFPNFFETSLGNSILTLYYPNTDNYNQPFIRLRQDQLSLNIHFIEEVTEFNRYPEMESELLALELSEDLKPNCVYKIIRKYIRLPLRIELGYINNIFCYYFWRLSVIGGKCISYQENSLSKNKNDYIFKKEIDLVNDTFRYETEQTEYSFKKGKLKFTTSSQSFEEVFMSCKAEIAAFKETMKHLLDD